MLRNIFKSKSNPALFQKKAIRYLSTPSIEKQISENPLAYYNKFKQRLMTQGLLAPFPEFKESVDYLETSLEKPEILALCQNKTIAHYKNLISTKLFHIKLNFKIDGVDYPHVPPYTAPYPYLPTYCGFSA
jgi:hypothetical protein